MLATCKLILSPILRAYPNLSQSPLVPVCVCVCVCVSVVVCRVVV